MVKKSGLHRTYIILLLLRAPFDAVRTWMLAGLMKHVFYSIETGDTENLVTKGVFYRLICVLLFLYNGTVWSIYAAFSAKVEVFLQKMVINRILSFSLRQVERIRNGEWLTRLNNDVQLAVTIMNAPLHMPHLVVATINTIIASALLFKCNLLLFCIVYAFTIPYLFINYGLVIKSVPKLKRESINAMAENTSSIEPLISDAEVIHIYEAEKLIINQCELSSRKIMEMNMRIHIRNSLSEAVIRFFGSFGYLVILLIGYYMICKGNMLLSDLVYGFQVRSSLIASLTMLIVSYNNIKMNSVCIDRLIDVLEEQSN